MNNTEAHHQTDEINLRELSATLWGNKLLILAITALFALAGVTYALLAPQEWSATATVVAPFPTQVEQLRLRREQIIKVTDQADFIAASSEAKLFTDFIQAFNSFDNKCEFLKSNGYIPKKDRKDELSLQRFLEKSVNKINARQRKTESFFILSFAADSATESKKRLISYINFLQAKEETAMNSLFTSVITVQTQAVTLNYRIRAADTLKRLQEEIERTELAVRISKSAGVEAPVQNLNNQTFFPIDLGAKALNEKLKILKEIKKPEIIAPALADLRLSLDSLQAVPQENVRFTSYHYLQSPTEPLNRDKPQRSLLVVLATLAGLMLAVMAVLFRAHWLHDDCKKN